MLASSRRCAACAMPNTLEAEVCSACGTLLPPVVLDSGGGAVAMPLGDAAVLEPLDDAAAGEQAWGEVRGVAWLFLSLIAVSTAGFLAVTAGGQEAQVDLVLSIVSAVAVLACVVAARDTVVPLLATGGGWRGVAGVGVGCAVLLSFGAIYFPAIEALGFPLVRITDPFMAAGWEPWAVYAIISAAPGVVEELAFRGYMMARLERLLTAKEALLVQAALFSVVHFGIVIFPSHFVFGVVLGLLRQRTGSLYPGMIVHAAWNAYCVWGELGS
jgi:hypothetical protein